LDGTQTLRWEGDGGFEFPREPCVGRDNTDAYRDPGAARHVPQDIEVFEN
jgi:hypothetical protein